MKRLFVVTFVAGLLVAALAAVLWPLPTHFRYRSLITVPPDGGRQEEFVIRWPEDRIRLPGASRDSLPATAAVGVAVLEDSAGQRVSAELFRLRDADDNVIGVASRMAGTGGAIADQGRSASNWLLVIPSRGALFLAQTDVLDMTVREQVTANGNVAFAPEQTGPFWTDRRSLRVTATVPATTGSATTGKVLRGTSEFAGLEGSFTETWNLEEVKADGSTQGRILLLNAHGGRYLTLRALVGVLGLVLGMLVGACLVLANPLAWFQSGLPPLSAEIAPVKVYRWQDYRGIEAGVADLLGVGQPDRDVALMDPALRHVRIGIVVLPAGEGAPAALAVKIAVIAEENSLWRAQLGTHDLWNIFWPGEGSVFASGYSNFWGVIRNTLFATAGDGASGAMTAAYPVSAPSPLGNSTGVTGAAGRYVRFTGEIRELLFPAPPESAPKDADWGIALKVNPSPVTTR